MDSTEQELQGTFSTQAAALEILSERIAELERALEDVGWLRFTQTGQMEFSREGLRRIVEISRLLYLKNPLINRAVSLQASYVWAQGATIRAKHPLLNGVIQQFLDDPKNQAELTGHQARGMKEIMLQVEGNLFLVLFVNRVSGKVRVRSIPTNQVTDIIADPEDAKTPWYYRREWTQVSTDPATGAQTTRLTTAYYPDWRYTPQNKPDTIGGHRVEWDAPVFHVRVGGLDDMQFGVPETYQAHDWARAYKDFLEDLATVWRSLARFAWQVKTGGTAKGVTAVKTRLNTTLASGSETNPAPIPGSTFIAGQGLDMQPMRTAGATMSAEDGRRLLLMVSAATGFPETFFGDVSVGTLATAKSLDRPTELKFKDRQALWTWVFTSIGGYVLYWAAAAPQGALRDYASTSVDDEGQPVVEWGFDDDGNEIDPTIQVLYPSLIEHDVAESVTAITEAATLGAPGTPAGTIDMKTVSRLLLTALGVDDVDNILETLYPEDGMAVASEAAMVSAVRELREAVSALKGAPQT